MPTLNHESRQRMKALAAIQVHLIYEHLDSSFAFPSSCNGGAKVLFTKIINTVHLHPSLIPQYLLVGSWEMVSVDVGEGGLSCFSWPWSLSSEVPAASVSLSFSADCHRCRRVESP
jgi:hypothetical protein